MKKSIIVLLAGILLLCFLFAACGMNKNDGNVTERNGGALTKESATYENNKTENNTKTTDSFMEKASDFINDTVTGVSDTLKEAFE